MAKVSHPARPGQHPASQGVIRRGNPALTKEQEIRKRVASRVRRFRYLREFSQSKAALIAEIDERTWQKLEAGTLNATLDMITRVAGALDVSPEDLVGTAEPPVLARPRD